VPRVFTSRIRTISAAQNELTHWNHSQIEKGRPGTDPNGPFRGLAKLQQKQHFPNDHARVHASPCSRHVTRSHMIKHRHGTLTAPRRDNGTQTKRETDQLWLSFGAASSRHRARLIAVSAPLLSNTTQAGVEACTKPGLELTLATQLLHESWCDRIKALGEVASYRPDCRALVVPTPAVER